MTSTTSLFFDDKYSRKERWYYSRLHRFFPEDQFLIYPNIALGLLVDPNDAIIQAEIKRYAEDHEDFFWECLLSNYQPDYVLTLSCVDLCILIKPAYIPYVVFEIDGPTHYKAWQRQLDAFKDAILCSVNIPVERIKFRKNRLPSEEGDLERTIRRLKNSLPSPTNVLGKAVFGDSELFRTLGLLNDLIDPVRGRVFPNVAVRTFLDNECLKARYHWSSNERSYGLTGFVDFLVVCSTLLQPVCALTLSRNDVQIRVLQDFSVPLIHLDELTCAPTVVRSDCSDYSRIPDRPSLEKALYKYALLHCRELTKPL
jgi:hypothetical protein